MGAHWLPRALGVKLCDEEVEFDNYVKALPDWEEMDRIVAGSEADGDDIMVPDVPRFPAPDIPEIQAPATAERAQPPSPQPKRGVGRPKGTGPKQVQKSDSKGMKPLTCFGYVIQKRAREPDNE
eukprot:PhM_4_TR3084/c1_g2_i4/m.53778